jgi:hypothetical protein
MLRLEVSALPMHNRERERDRGTDLPHGWQMRGRVGGEGREC